MSYKNYTLKQREIITEKYKKHFHKGLDIYLMLPDCVSYMSPIERNVWSDLKSNGIKMYPQYPVGKYFIDFADPFKLIGIEVDGKEFHKDIEKDQKRQKELEDIGWKIFRIKGSWTFNELDEDEFYEDEYLEKKQESEGEYNYRKIFNKIKEIYAKTH